MLKIALCDFNHETVGIHTETMPLAIGLIGSYTAEMHKDAVDVRLYKLTGDFIADLNKGWVPEVMGLSCYTWNTNLNIHMAEHIRSVNPRIITIMGGAKHTLA